MNEIIKAIVLGIVQGITEFLPISSTAHLRIVPEFFSWEDPGAAYSAVIQIGTMLAVIIYFYKDLVKYFSAVILEIPKLKFGRKLESKLGWFILIGTIPIVVAGLLLENFIENQARSLYIIAFNLLFFALLLAIAEKFSKRKYGIKKLTFLRAMLMGIAQVFALIPGASRSGVTITGGLFAGLTREAAARFSFLLSVPAVFLSGMYEFYKYLPIFTRENLLSLLIATIFSFISGYLSIGFLLRYLRTKSTFIFIYYRIALSVLIFILTYFRIINP